MKIPQIVKMCGIFMVKKMRLYDLWVDFAER